MLGGGNPARLAVPVADMAMIFSSKRTSFLSRTSSSLPNTSAILVLISIIFVSTSLPVMALLAMPPGLSDRCSLLWARNAVDHQPLKLGQVSSGKSTLLAFVVHLVA